jgi:hypothetical protein
MCIYWKIAQIPQKMFIDASKDINLEVNAEKTKYVLLYRHQNAGQNHDIKTANRYLENVGEFIYLGLTVSSQNLIQEEIKSILSSGNACYHSLVNLLSSRMLSKKRKNYNIQDYNFVRGPAWV